MQEKREELKRVLAQTVGREKGKIAYGSIEIF